MHDRFQTVALEFDGRTIDVVTARRESYPEPGALPEVTPSSLADDLARRDFTVNALALCIRGPDMGSVADASGGLGDLDSGLIRRIREGEFTEDPSRIVRAARYAARLGFEVASDTAPEIATSAPDLDLGSARVGDELTRLAEEDSAAAALRLLADWGAPWATPVTDDDLATIDAASERPGAPSVAIWCLRLGEAIAPTALAGAALPGWAIEAGGGATDGPALADELRGAPASQVDVRARQAGEAAQIFAVASGSEEIAAWWGGGRDLELDIDGDDLLSAGVSAGPLLGRALAAARAAALDGAAPDRAAQLRIALDEAQA